MVANLTVGKAKQPADQALLPGLLKEAYRLIDGLKDGARQDIEAFSAFMAVLQLSRTTPEEKAIREKRRQEALHLCCQAPMQIARLCRETLMVCRRLAEMAGKMVVSDVAVGAILAEASLRGALVSAEANVPYITDRDYLQTYRQEKAALLSQGEQLCRETVERVSQRMAGQ